MLSFVTDYFGSFANGFLCIVFAANCLQQPQSRQCNTIGSHPTNDDDHHQRFALDARQSELATQLLPANPEATGSNTKAGQVLAPSSLPVNSLFSSSPSASNSTTSRPRKAVHLPLNEAHRSVYFGYPSRSVQNPQADLKMQREVSEGIKKRVQANPEPYVLLDAVRRGTTSLLEEERKRAQGNQQPARPFASELSEAIFQWLRRRR